MRSEFSECHYERRETIHWQVDFSVSLRVLLGPGSLGNRRGLGDSRGQLIWDIVDWLQRSAPKAFVLENVPQLLAKRNEKAWRKIRFALERILAECAVRALV